MHDQKEIIYKFDKKINGYLIIMPNFVTVKMIEQWKKQFDKELKIAQNNSHYSLLIDTNKHKFESIQCLKSLRDYLSYLSDSQNNLVRAAFVSPPNFRTPQITSEFEAYFDDYEKAYQWLKSAKSIAR